MTTDTHWYLAITRFEQNNPGNQKIRPGREFDLYPLIKNQPMFAQRENNDIHIKTKHRSISRKKSKHLVRLAVHPASLQAENPQPREHRAALAMPWDQMEASPSVPSLLFRHLYPCAPHPPEPKSHALLKACQTRLKTLDVTLHPCAWLTHDALDYHLSHHSDRLAHAG
ncbi:hypothetical protein [Beijerinckia indica]|uniref:hypothetical protein n=1 Tax=Beijerinckia indica TaxID=533 RepID=UPI0013054198|nr:hypothetical protein [Beijerinckia indica]